jgi:hypothetical protein
MLDENRQLRNFRTQRPDGTTIPDEYGARQTMASTLRAIGKWHKEQGKSSKEVTPELRRVYAAVDRLTEHPIMEIKMQAENTRQTFFR